MSLATDLGGDETKLARPSSEPALGSMRFVALDLETTGFDPARDRVIEVGAVAFNRDRVLDRLEEFADPGRPVPLPVLQLTGIKSADLTGAQSPAVALERLMQFVGDAVVVGHGGRLDMDFLIAEGLWPQQRELLDTLELARILLPDASSYSLPQLVRELGLNQPRPHRALDDADATRQLLWHLADRVLELPPGLRGDILDLVEPYDYPTARFLRLALGGAPRGSGRSGDFPPRAPEVARRHAPAGEVSDRPEELAALLAPGGRLSSRMPDYEPRDSQVQMLLAVAQNLRRGGRLVLEAGTGTGKSLAYLIPAAARAVAQGERVIISTHTHTLQEQILEHDLPDLQDWLPFDFTSALLKGRSNYLSWRRWRRHLAEPCQSSEELAFKLKILLWLERTTTGDRSELRLYGREEWLWGRIASDPLDCVGHACTPADCFVHRARARAEEADLIVVNHHLLLADASTGNNLLPAHQHLIVDEAHHLEEAATQGLTVELDRSSLNALLAQLGQGLLPALSSQSRLDRADDELEPARSAARSAQERVRVLFERTQDWAQGQLGGEERRESTLRLQPRSRHSDGWSEVSAIAGDATTALAALDARLRRALSLAQGFAGEPDQALREVEIVRVQLGEAASLIQELFLSPDPERVYWIRILAREQGLSLCSAPISVGPLLAERVYSNLDSVLFTSASLSVGGDFSYFHSVAGLGSQTDSMILASPFDYLAQALICLPSDAPEPQSPEFEPWLALLVAEVTRRLDGRTMVLFTSHRQLRDVHAALKARTDLDGIAILGQGLDGQRHQLLKAFVSAPRALLLGTSAFWEGVDVPGDRLSCVVIARLPFPVPSDPVFAARSERRRDSFRQLTLPVAALRLKQGFGRLIRRRSDRGAVIILDSRILNRDYGRAFLDALPPASRFIGPSSEIGARVEAWVRPQ